MCDRDHRWFHVFAVPAALAVLCLSLWTGCRTASFCCLNHERGSPEMTYCNDHSAMAGHFLLDAEDESAAARDTALQLLEGLYRSSDTCATIACIERLLRNDPGLADLWMYYEDDHDDADASLASRGASLDDAEKAELIRCGFHDAIERTRENIKEGGPE